MVGMVVPAALVIGLIATLVALPTTNSLLFGFQQLDLDRIFLASLLLSIPIAGLLLVFVFVALRGWRLRRPALLGLFFCTLVGFPATGFGGAVILNVALDWSDPMSRRALVTSKPIGRYHAIQVASWRHPSDSETLYVDAALYDRILAGSTILTIWTKPGLLGYEWVSGYAEAGR